MFKRILVPLDGSTLAETALAPAVSLAERFGAELVLVRAILTHAFPGADPGPAQLEALHEAEHYLGTLTRRLQGKNIPIRTAIPYDAPAAGIADQAEIRHVDLMVMSTHGRKWPETLLHPSITMKVLAHTNAPILALKYTEDDVGENTPPLPRFMTDPTAPIVVPLDGSLLAESALPLAEGLAKTFGNPLVLLRAAERPRIAVGTIEYPAVIADAEHQALNEARSYLQRKQGEAASRGMRVSIESAASTPAWFIEDTAQKYAAGLVVIASHGRGGMGRWLLGSVAQHVLRDGEVPVLLVRLQQPGCN